MSYVIYKHASKGSQCERLYLINIPDDDDFLGGVGYQGIPNGVPDDAGTAPTEEDAQKICEWLRTAFYGPEEEHFYEKAPTEVEP